MQYASPWNHNTKSDDLSGLCIDIKKTLGFNCRPRSRLRGTWPSPRPSRTRNTEAKIYSFFTPRDCPSAPHVSTEKNKKKLRKKSTHTRDHFLYVPSYLLYLTIIPLGRGDGVDKKGGERKRLLQNSAEINEPIQMAYTAVTNGTLLMGRLDIVESPQPQRHTALPIITVGWPSFSHFI